MGLSPGRLHVLVIAYTCMCRGLLSSCTFVPDSPWPLTRVWLYVFTQDCAEEAELWAVALSK